MSWVKIDDRLAFHPKVLAAGNEAMGVWVRMLSWCGAHLTDGVVSGDIIRVFDPSGDAIERLRSVGLIDLENDIYVIHDYLRYNPSREEVEAEREAGKQRQAKSRKRRESVTDAVSHTVTDGVTDTVTDGVTSPDPSRPVPTRPHDDMIATPADFENRWHRRIGGGVIGGRNRIWVDKAIAEGVTTADLDAALDTQGTSVKYLAKAAMTHAHERREAGQHKPRAGPGQGDGGYLEGTRKLIEGIGDGTVTI